MKYSELVTGLAKDRGDRGVFHDLMRYRVREILLVGSLYDSFIVESDGFLTEQIYGEYFRLNLSTIPRVTSAYTDESALERFSSGNCDLVVIMAGLDFERPLRLATEMKSRTSAIPVLLLVLNNSSLAELDTARPELAFVDRVFVWNGYSKLLVGMIKYVEDRGNVDSDTASGMVKVILLIEDSIRYYSRYLPLLYTVVLKQTQALIEEERGVETYRLLRSRARPKILLAATYEEAEQLLTRYENSLLALITDLRFQHGGRMDAEAGFSFVRMARSRKPDLPVMIQSSEVAVRKGAETLGAAFADKSSESLALELGDFLRNSLGFGPFRFLDADGAVIGIAATIEEFMTAVGEVPGDCLLRHAERNHFSTWLTARGEYRFASLLRHYSIEDFSTATELRSFILHVLDLVRREKSEGLVPDFEESIFRDALSMTRLGSGSVGGKGRGIEFLKRVAETEQLGRDFPSLSIMVPRTLFIGIDEFEDFLESNNLWSFAYYSGEPGDLITRFGQASFSESFRERVRRFLTACANPLALRSSGLLEDMVALPFAGVYDTCFLPNSNPDLESRLEQFLAGLRRVWASVFSSRARKHFEVVGYYLEEERMAVIVQELVGHRSGSNWAPKFSGLALTTVVNFAADEEVRRTTLAFAPGLGVRVTCGGVSLLASLEKRGEGIESQLELSPIPNRDEKSCNLDLNGTVIVAGEGELSAHSLAERNFAQGKDSALFFLNLCGPALDRILGLLTRAYANDIALEFAYDADEDGGKSCLFLLQARPIQRLKTPRAASSQGELKNDLFSGQAFGPVGELQVEDLILIRCFDPSTPFDPMKTSAIIAELRALDRRIASTGRRYALVGAGRWGDHWDGSGLPLEFADVSHACLVVEGVCPASDDGPPIGSHFFFNIVASGASWLRIKAREDGEILSRSAIETFTPISTSESWQWLRSRRPLLWQSKAGEGALMSEY